MIEHVSEGLGTMSPGAALGVVLARLDPARLGGHDRVVVMVAWARQVAHAQAQLAAAMYQTSLCPTDGPPDGPMAEVEDHFAVCEIAAALRLTRRAARYQLDLATALHQFPAVGAALARGEIDLPRAEVIRRAVSAVPDEVAGPLAAAAAGIAPRLTTGQLRAHLGKMVITADPAAAQRRYHDRVQARAVSHWRGHEGAAYLGGADLPVERAAAAYARIGAIADTLKRGGDRRSMDQLRADVFLDLLEGVDLPTAARPAASRGRTDVVVSLSTLIGLNQDPGAIPGWGPVLAQIARGIATTDGQAWRFRLTDDAGRLLHTGPIHPPGTRSGRSASGLPNRDRPEPSVAGEYAFVQTRDQHCRYPGCRTPARRCDIDHTTPRHRGGPDTRGNLSVLCRHHHRAKDEGGYQLRQLGHGCLEWTTPRGHTYRTEPDAAP